MEDFRYYSPEDVIYANLRETVTRMDMLQEQEMAHLKELAVQISKDLDGYPDFISSLPDLLPTAIRSAIPPLDENADALRRQAGVHQTLLSLFLCMEIDNCIHQRGELTPAHFFADVEEIPLHAADRIVYQRSSYADSAYLRFAELLSSPRASYTHSFQGACEEVYNGLCEYCILPLENSSEGQLNTFSRLIDRYGLKIAATAEIVASDGLRSTRFALLRKNLLPILRYGKRNYFFEFSVPLSQSPSSAEILLSAQLCGLRLYRVDTRSGQDPGRQSIIRYVFHAESNALTAFLLYLCMTAPHYEAAGIYPHLAAQSTE